MSKLTHPLNVVIVGHGAIGSLWSYHLSKAKNIQLSFIGSDGISESSSFQSFTFTNIKGLGFQYQVKRATAGDLGAAHLVIACLKSFQMASAINLLAEYITTSCDIILCHNGMGVIDGLCEEITSTHPLYTLLTTHGCLRKNKYHAIHTGVGHCDIGKSVIKVGEKMPTWLSPLNSVFPEIFWHNDIRQKQWQKLAVNCVINPITAIHKVNNGQIKQARFRTLIENIAIEVAMVAQKEKIDLSAEFITNAALSVAEKTALNTSSMLADVLALRETEINNINGYIVSLAKQHSLDVPYNQRVTAEVKALNC